MGTNRQEEFKIKMAGVNKRGSKSDVKNFTVDPLASLIPPGEEHNRCREALENSGAGVNVPDEDGLTSLMFTVKENHPQCVNELIKAGANVNVRDEKSLTPLIVAVTNDHLQCVNELIKAGADVNIADKDL